MNIKQLGSEIIKVLASEEKPRAALCCRILQEKPQEGEVVSWPWEVLENGERAAES